MPFRAAFDCLWCGRAHETRAADDIEGWAQLCPGCVGRAGENGFLRFRLRTALGERARADPLPAEPTASGTASVTAGSSSADTTAGTTAGASSTDAPSRGQRDADAEMRAYYAARAPEYDDWYLRRGRYSHGSMSDLAWQAELDGATTWLDSLPMRGEIVELAAGTGWWSPLLAQKGELSIYDAVEEPLGRARERLLAHRLRAHIHVRDAWADPDRQVDALFTGFWLSHVPRARLHAFLRVAHRWLKPGGIYAFVDSLNDPESGAADRIPPSGDLAVRRLADGRQFTIPKVFYTPSELESALLGAGFRDATVTTTGRFFLLGRAAA